ncbi:MAG: MBL fold metallo-hydrolase [Candidatus Gastranaerophilales bacterium]|nr:MBL fold metallo-hydrolase [Candidatus Gastranaerophilales bacterium]
MQIHQIRNATIIITYNNKKFLIDPWLMPKEYMAGFEAGLNSNIRQPRVELPISIEEIVDVDAVILTHYHPDHWDEFAAKALDKNIPFFVQSKDDFNIIKNSGFNDVRIIEEVSDFAGIKLYKTDCQHGRREIIKPLCEQVGMPYDSMGIVFKSENEKTLYLAGDTIFCNEVKCALDKYKPDVIIVNACGATTITGEKIIMDCDDIKAIVDYAPKAIIVASHMDTVSHLTVTRDDIKNLKLNNVVVPDDNEILEF